MATGTAKVNGIYTANISKVDSIAVANIASMNGITWASNSSMYNGAIANSCMFSDAATTYTWIDEQTTIDSDYKKKVWSCWVKRTRLSDTMTLNWFYGDGTNFVEILFDATDALHYRTYFGGSYQMRRVTTRRFRDCSSWYHIYISVDTTNATATDRCKIYINGVQETDFDNEVNPVQNYDVWYQGHAVGYDNIVGSRDPDGGNYGFDGYMADLYILDGQSYADHPVTDFGEFSDGIWIPKTPTGLTYGNNGVHLDFADSTDFGKDVSGNANHHTDANLGTDHQVSDTPENNYCIWDINTAHTSGTMEEGGLSWRYATGTWIISYGNFLLKTGKWYFELDCNGDGDEIAVGIEAAGEYSGDRLTAPGYIGDSAFSWGIHNNASVSVFSIYNNASGTNDDNLTAPDGNDVIMVAIDCDAGKIWFGADGTWGDFGATGVGDPATGTNPAFSGLDFDLYDYVPAISVQSHSVSIANFGQRTFTHTAPTGFNSLCSENLGEPTVIEPPAEAINVVTYSGDGTSPRAITGVGFQPDMVWIQCRSFAYYPFAYDSVRGVDLGYNTAFELAEQNQYVNGYLSAFSADGFSVTAGATSDNSTNDGDDTYVAWCLKKGAAYGFDIQTFTGTGAAHTETHDLGVVPEMMIFKNRDRAMYSVVYHHHALNKTDPETDYQYMHLNTGFTDLNTMWNDTAPTSSVFTVGTHNNVNQSGDDIFVYLFASVPGVSKVFSYEGNGNAAGPYIYCGFAPRWIMYKNADASNSWVIHDTERSPYNQMDNYLHVDDYSAEDTAGENEIDCFANGFKIRCTDAESNTNNNTYIGIAWADQPFKYANAR
jgi:hypothetical protein